MTRLRGGQWPVQTSNPSRGKWFFCSPKCLNQLWSPTSLLFNGYQGYIPWVNWPAHEVNHSPPIPWKVKNGWSYTSPSPVCLHAMDRENFTFLSTRVLPSGYAMLYYMLNAPLFLLPQLISNIRHSLCCNSCSMLNIFLDLSQYFTVNAACFNF